MNINELIEENNFDDKVEKTNQKADIIEKLDYL